METCTLRECRTWLPGRDFPTQPLLLQEQCLPPRHSPWCCGGSGAPRSTQTVPYCWKCRGRRARLRAWLPSSVPSCLHKSTPESCVGLTQDIQAGQGLWGLGCERDHSKMCPALQIVQNKPKGARRGPGCSPGRQPLGSWRRSGSHRLPYLSSHPLRPYYRLQSRQLH